MEGEHRNRRAALEGLGKILDAGALEELFAGPDEEALFLYDLLLDATRGRASVYYWEICRTARRRGVSPEFVVDRALVLHATMVERRRTDLYRILGVPPLSSNDTIRRRWLEIAKIHHPDVGGDGAVFRQAKQAYDVLSDAGRRGDYERFWLRALGPFERVSPLHPELLPPTEPEVRTVPLAAPTNGHDEPAVAPQATSVPVGLEGLTDALRDAARVLEAGATLDRRLQGEAGVGAGIAGFLARIEKALASVQREELDRLRADALAVIARLETEQRDLAALGAMRRTLDRVRLAS